MGLFSLVPLMCEKIHLILYSGFDIVHPYYHHAGHFV